MPQTQYIKIILRLVNDESLAFNPQSNFMRILYILMVYKASGGLPRGGRLSITLTTIMKPWSWHWTVLKLEACNSTPKYEWFWFSFYFEFISQLEIPLLPVTTFQRILGQEHSRPAFGGVADTKPSKCWRCSVTLPSPLYLQKSQPPDVPRMLIFQDASKYFIIDKNSSFSLFSLLSLPQFHQKKNIRQRAFANGLLNYSLLRKQQDFSFWGCDSQTERGK